jgi:hypothetical protein
MPLAERKLPGPIDPISEAESDPYRNSLCALAASLSPTHLVTLNTHRLVSVDHAVGCVMRWRAELLRRLCGRRFFARPVAELMEFVGFPELTLSRHPHFHLICRVPLSLGEQFQALAPERWKLLVPSGTYHSRRIDHSAGSLERLLGYVTKKLDAKSSQPFVDGRVF